MTSSRQRLAGRIHVDLPPGEAFRLFTPRGEEDWAHGWRPRFPVSAADDTEPGTVFETHAHDQHATWLVTSRDPGKHISYARVIPGEQAGTVTVMIRASAGGTEVEVVYDVTALTDAASLRLREFAAGYPAYLRSWHDAIIAWLTSQRGCHSDPVS
jgi:hypothetical protein